MPPIEDSLPHFDMQSAAHYLENREARQVTKQEELRLRWLKKSIAILQQAFYQQAVEVWLIGSILKPGRFTSRSDIDIVVKNFKGDRFDLWSLLESQLERDIEIIRFEECHFQTDILKEGLKIK